MINDVQHQRSHTTAYNRHPRMFRLAAASVSKKLRPEELKILSYGCSTGEEPHCLSTMYFPGARVIGMDVSERVLEQARQKHSAEGIEYVLSTASNLSRYGPYDCITAMSVLCRWPASENLDDISGLYTFSQFEDAVRDLDANLRVEGILVIFNSNFNFLDTVFASRYEVIPMTLEQHNGYVHRFGRDNRRLENYVGNDCVYRKKVA